MSNIFVKPGTDAQGQPLLVRDPATRVALAAQGEWKAQTQFWLRRIRDGDVIDMTHIAARSGALARGGPAARSETKPDKAADRKTARV